MIIIEYVFLGLYGIIIGIDKLFSVLFGPCRVLVYAFIVFMLALPAIQKTVSWQRYKAYVEDIQHKLKYGNLSSNEIWFLEHNYNNIVEYMIKARKWDVVKKIKKIKTGKYRRFIRIHARMCPCRR